jgi:hypothetical protein
MSSFKRTSNIQARPDSVDIKSEITGPYQETNGQPRYTPFFPCVFQIAQHEQVPDSGTLYVRLVGTGNVASIVISDNINMQFNSGSALVSGAGYEFAIHLVKGEYVTISGAICAGLLFRSYV